MTTKSLTPRPILPAIVGALIDNLRWFTSQPAVGLSNLAEVSEAETLIQQIERNPPDLIDRPHLAHWPVVQILPGAIYVRLPAGLRKDCGGCSCTYCTTHPQEIPSWDTLGIELKPGGHTWTVHAPEWNESTPQNPNRTRS